MTKNNHVTVGLHHLERVLGERGGVCGARVCVCERETERERGREGGSSHMYNIN